VDTICWLRTFSGPDPFLGSPKFISNMRV